MSWADPARTSAIALMTGEERQDDSVTATLIRDIHAIFTANAQERMKTADLLAELYEIEESPWGDWSGRPLSAHALSLLLHTYRIKTMTVRVDGNAVRGYKIEQFSDAFEQLALPSVTGVTTVTTFSQSQAGSNARNAHNASTREQGENGRPLIGDKGYLDFLYEKKQGGWITATEFNQVARVHAFVRDAAPLWTCPKCNRMQPRPALIAGVAYCRCGGLEAVEVETA